MAGNEKKTAHVTTRLDHDDVQGHVAHSLSHELDADALALITIEAGTGSVQCSFRMGCHVTDPRTETELAQAMRQACAMLSKSLRERYVERSARPGDVVQRPVPEADDPVDGDAPKLDPKKVH